MKKQFLLILSLAVFGNPTANGAGLVNGSFESPALAVPWQPYTPTPSFGWTVASGDIDLIGSNWQASDGTQSIDLNGFGPGSIFQDFNFPTSGLWVIKFDMSANPDPAQQGTKSLRVDFGNSGGSLASLGNFSVSNAGRTHANMQYIEYSTSPLSVNDLGLYRLQFTSLTGDTSGPVLDNVRLVVVPEPSLLSLTGLGLAVVYHRLKQRNR